MSVSVTVVAPAAQEAVWERWTDFAGWPRWNPQCIGATLDGPLAPGTTPRAETCATRAARLLHARPRLAAVEPPDEIVWGGSGEGSACARRPGRR